ncbi:DMT family transporter [Ancylobacter oerskovii]|uniref:DMT family transporter n=1 Tax=Ancylobacter oerskovii TaxID=459519 RepID=A0ABW4Z511_9HYPH|nr:DMT family transporter [Ancylobacter oerskovii]MBS7545847.1 DMT family transporter [Ancylobacter oerskovii]
MNPKDLIAYVALAVIWGLSFVVVLRVVHAFGWVGAVTLRAFVAAGTLLLVAVLTGRRLDFSVGWTRLAVVGATSVALQLAGLNYAMPMIGTAMSAILVATIPLFSMLIAQLSGIERLSASRKAGLALGFAGVLLLVGFPVVPLTTSFVIGCLCSLASAFFAAYGSNYVGHRLRDVGAWEVTIGSFLTGGAMLLPLFALVPVPGTPLPLDYLFLFVAGALMSGLTYLLYFWLVGRLGATRAVSVEFAVTLVAVAVGAGLLGEPLSLPQIAGAATVVLGCALVLGLFGRGRRELAAS